MVFSSNFFIYVFFPLFLLFYFTAVKTFPKSTKAANAIILLFSLTFYLFTGGFFVLLLLAVIIWNYILALAIEKYRKKLLLIVTVGGDILLFLYFKYAIFIYENVLGLLRLFSQSFQTVTLNIILPVGISFYIFQALSYVVDVYRKDVRAQKNLFSFALYISMFPQLVAGPIVRYSSVDKEISARVCTFEDVYHGICRFIFGLGKKVIIADILGQAVDSVWALPDSNLSTPLAWAGAVLYTLQIYFDFSGYSDMAIGIGRIIGFHFPENFVKPYTAENLTDFWRRWHVSLSTFLRDYLYIPLGGNRKGAVRTYINLLVVFTICGLWHGAAWNFVVWGIYHGLFRMLEYFLKDKFHFCCSGIVGRVFTLFVVCLGWVFFRAESVTRAFGYLGVMFGGEKLAGLQFYQFGYYVPVKVWVIALLATGLAVFRLPGKFRINDCVKGIAAVIVLLISMAYMSDASFTPFIYFQFWQGVRHWRGEANHEEYSEKDDFGNNAGCAGRSYAGNAVWLGKFVCHQ